MMTESSKAATGPASSPSGVGVRAPNHVIYVYTAAKPTRATESTLTSLKGRVVDIEIYKGNRLMQRELVSWWRDVTRRA